MEGINKYLGGCFRYAETGSCIASADLDPATSSADSKSSACRKAGPSLEGNPGRSSTNDVHELLECPVCTNLMYPPIYQCPNGHTLCSNCKAEVHNCCPICRHELGNIRCLALEKVAEPLELPCRYQILGCQDIFPYQSMLEHEKHCKYRPYNCPYHKDVCFVTGDISSLLMHLKNDHKVLMWDGHTSEPSFLISNTQEVGNCMWKQTVVNCFGCRFLTHFEAFHLGTAPVYMAFLRFMGDEDEAKQFSYSLEVEGNGRKLTWQGIPRSIRDSHQMVRDSHDGLIIPRNLAHDFSCSHGEKLELKITRCIWKKQ